MSHKDYTKFSAKPRKENDEPISSNEQEALKALESIDGITVEYDKPVSVENNDDSVVEEVKEEKVLFINGIVDKCERLNVREKASVDSDILKVIDKGTEVIIDVEKSTDEFFKVSIDGVDGYCMKKFITSSNLNN